MLNLIAKIRGEDELAIAQGMKDLHTFVTSGGTQMPESSTYTLLRTDIQNEITQEEIEELEQAFVQERNYTQMLLILEGDDEAAILDGLLHLAGEFEEGEYDMTGRQGPDWQALFCQINA